MATDTKTRDLDALIAEKIMGDPGTTYWYASNDGGKSGCLFSNSHRDDLFSTRREIRAWLDEQKSRNRHMDYEIVERVKFRRYSTDWSAMQEVIAMVNDYAGHVSFWFYQIHKTPFESRKYDWRAGITNAIGAEEASVCAHTLPEAVCLAALAWAERRGH